MAEIEDLNVTDASNTARFAEGQAPSTVNDGARALEGLLARWRNDTTGRIVSGGSANAHTLAAAGVYAAYADGQAFVFRAGFTNTGATTLNVDGIGAIAVTKNNGAALTGGEIQAGGVYGVTLIAGSPNVWRLHNPSELVQPRVDVASATTTDIGAAASQYVRVTGTTTITGLGTADAGIVRDVLFGGALTLTHNATSLILPSAANITTAAGDTALLRSEGSGNWRCMRYQKASGVAIVGGSGGILHVRDEKASGTEGGAFTSGAYRTRDLDTVATNTITGASLSSNQITLPAGTYYVIARAPASLVNDNVARLQDITNGTTLIRGASRRASNSGAGETDNLVIGQFTLAGTVAIELQHRCELTVATFGFGTASTFGDNEVYAEVLIQEVL